MRFYQWCALGCGGFWFVERFLARSPIVSGLDDDTVLHRANQNGALLITADKDVGELVFRQGRFAICQMSNIFRVFAFDQHFEMMEISMLR
ncbi:DUF5615 family PIN-like protein [Candidatus Poribacteria bacterium]|nr:DUF5615 family PIN-like protein [Candidatus Poribacteria bacterium]